MRKARQSRIHSAGVAAAGLAWALMTPLPAQAVPGCGEECIKKGGACWRGTCIEKLPACETTIEPMEVDTDSLHEEMCKLTKELLEGLGGEVTGGGQTPDKTPSAGLSIGIGGLFSSGGGDSEAGHGRGASGGGVSIGLDPVALLASGTGAQSPAAAQTVRQWGAEFLPEAAGEPPLESGRLVKATLHRGDAGAVARVALFLPQGAKPAGKVVKFKAGSELAKAVHREAGPPGSHGSPGPTVPERPALAAPGGDGDDRTPVFEMVLATSPAGSTGSGEPLPAVLYAASALGLEAGTVLELRANGRSVGTLRLGTVLSETAITINEEDKHK